MHGTTAIGRRTFLGRSSIGVGTAALAALLDPRAAAAATHVAPRARRVIWLTQSGAPSQLDLFDYKPGLADRFDHDLPESVRGEQRLTGMTSGQKRFPIALSIFRFARHGDAGMWISELPPRTAKLADELCVIRSPHTKAINHDPAMTLLPGCRGVRASITR